MTTVPIGMKNPFNRARLPSLRRAGDVVTFALVSVLAGCGVLGSPSPKPRTLDDTYGQLYSQEEYEKCVAKDAYNARCDRHIMRRNVNPEFWPYPDVPPMRWPDPPSEPVYRDGMTPLQYFEALCAAEAGEFIYETVKTAGIYEIRPRKHETDYAMRDPYVVEDPYGTTGGEEEEWIMYTYLYPEEDVALGKGYYFFETPWRKDARILSARLEALQERSEEEPIRHYFGYEKRNIRAMRMKWTKKLQSTVGFNWRGIKRPRDRDMAIAGGELAVVDLRTNKVLGLRRGFVLGGKLPDGGVSWHSGLTCPRYSEWGLQHVPTGRDKGYDSGLWFIRRVAVPSIEPLEK